MQEFQRFIGQRVIVTAPIGRDNFGRRDGSMIRFAGECESLGPNELLGYPLQICVGRMPVQIQSLSQIQLAPVKGFFRS